MAQPARKLAHIQVDLEEDALLSYPGSVDDIASEMRLLWIINQVREKRIGHSRAAHLAGMRLESFLRLLSKHRVPVLELDDDELQRQLEDNRSLRP